MRVKACIYFQLKRIFGLIMDHKKGIVYEDPHTLHKSSLVKSRYWQQTGKFGFTEFSNGIGRNCGMLCFYQMSTNIFLSDIHVANIWQKLLSQWSVIKFEQIPSLCRYNSLFYQRFNMMLGGKDAFCSIFWKNWVKSWRNHK